jgi:hypothetical protein
MENTEIGNLVTTLGNPNELIGSQFGRIPYLEWCEKESARLNDNTKGRKHAVFRHLGKVAITKI